MDLGRELASTDRTSFSSVNRAALCSGSQAANARLTCSANDSGPHARATCARASAGLACDARGMWADAAGTPPATSGVPSVETRASSTKASHAASEPA